MVGTEVHEVLTTLDNRRDLMQALADGEYEQPELVDHLDASRSTVYRGITELQSLHLVEYGGNGYRLTMPGRYLFERYRSFAADVTPAMNAAELLAVLPRGADVDPTMLQDADVVTASPPDSAAPGRRMKDLLSSATRIRGLAMAETQTDARELYRDLFETGTPMSFVFESSFLDHLRSIDLGTDMAASENVSFAAVEDIPYGCFVVDHSDGRTAVLLVYDGDKRLRGALFNESEAACEWAVETFETYRDRATAAEA